MIKKTFKNLIRRLREAEAARAGAGPLLAQDVQALLHFYDDAIRIAGGTAAPFRVFPRGESLRFLRNYEVSTAIPRRPRRKPSRAAPLTSDASCDILS